MNQCSVNAITSLTRSVARPWGGESAGRVPAEIKRPCVLVQTDAMNLLRQITRRSFNCLLVLGILAACAGLAADGEPGTVKVSAILGQAQLSKAGGAFTPLGPGMVLRPGDLVQTATGSAVDLYLGEIPGTVRLTQGSTVTVDKVMAGGADGGAGFEVQLSLRSGELLGLAKPVPAGSRFEIKIATGIAQIHEGRYRVDAAGRVVVVEGKALFAHVQPGGEASAHTLTGPPGTYFAPLEGIQPVTKDLKREIINQMRSKLPRR